MALDPRAAMLKINQERMDVQKGLAASQADIGKKLTKKGTKGALGSWLGQLAAPVLADWGTTALLNVFAPGLGSLYKAAKGVPLLKAGAKGLLTAYGGAKGGQMGADSVSIGDSEDLMKKHLAGTISGEKSMRFDRGATESMESQKELQLQSLSDLMKKDAGVAGLKSFGSSLLGDLKQSVKSSIGGGTQGGDQVGIRDRLKGIRETQGELTTQDYMSAFTESSEQAKKDLLSTQSLKDWSSKREGMNLGQVMKWSDEDLAGMAGKVNIGAGLQSPAKVDDSFMQQQLNQSLGIQDPNDVGSVRMFESTDPGGFEMSDFGDIKEGTITGKSPIDFDYTGSNTRLQPPISSEMMEQFPTYEQATQPQISDFNLQQSDVFGQQAPKTGLEGIQDIPMPLSSHPTESELLGIPMGDYQTDEFNAGQWSAVKPGEGRVLGAGGYSPSPNSDSLRNASPISGNNPLGYEKMMSDIYNNQSYNKKSLLGSPKLDNFPTYEQATQPQISDFNLQRKQFTNNFQAPNKDALMKNIFGQNYFNNLQGGRR